MKTYGWQAMVVVAALMIGVAVSCNAILGFDPGELATADGGATVGGGGAGAAAGTGGVAGAAGHGGAEPFAHIWSRRFGDVAEQSVNDLAVDGDGNVYLVGQFSGELDFGCDLHRADGAPADVDGYIAKLNADGSCAWSRSFGDDAWQTAADVALAPDGSVVVVGTFEGEVDLGWIEASQAAGGSDVFVARYAAATGDCRMAEYYGHGSNEWASQVTVDADGDIYLAGPFHGNIDFGGQALSADDGRDLFLVKLRESGSSLVQEWNTQVRVSGTSNVRDLLLYDDGGTSPIVYLVGDYEYDGGFAIGGVGAAGGAGGTGGSGGASGRFRDGFVALFEADSGQLRWSETIGGEGLDLPYDAAISDQGSVLLTGTYSGTLSVLGHVTHAALQNSNDMFLAGLTADQQYVENVGFSAVGWDSGRSVTVDGQGNIVVSGDFVGTIRFFTSEPLLATQGQDLFLVKFNAAREFLASRSYGGSEDQHAAAVAVDPTGHITLAGDFKGSLDFGGDILEAATSFSAPDGGMGMPEKDIFVARLGP